MKVLVDTSVWIEFFRARPQLPRDSLDFLDLLIADDRAVTILPIQAEVLSGRVSTKREREIREAFGALEHVDLDWNASSTWDDVVALARVAQKSSHSIPGIVDRMILLSAQRSESSLWTLDQSLIRLAPEVGVRLFS